MPRSRIQLQIPSLPNALRVLFGVARACLCAMFGSAVCASLAIRSRDQALPHHRGASWVSGDGTPFGQLLT